MVTPEQSQAVLSEIDDALETIEGRDALLHATMNVIARRLPHYNWVGVYMLDGGVLNLGPYVGAKTEHVLIPVGKGICGTAVSEDRNLVVDDVRAVDNYLACSLETRSEIVVLIRAAETGQILGQIDADGHTVGAFNASDESLLTNIAEKLAPHMWRADD
jgi:GAF domain-containing protein